MGKFLQKLKKNSFSVKQFICLFVLGILGIAFLQFQQAAGLLQKQRETLLESMQGDLLQANSFIDNDVNALRNLLQSLSLREDLFDFSDPAVQKRLFSIRKNNELVQTIYVSDKTGAVYSSSQALYNVVGDPHVARHMENARAYPNVIQYSEPYYTSMLAGYAVCAALSFGGGERVVAVEMTAESLYAGIQPVLGGQDKRFLLASPNGAVILFDRNLPAQTGRYPLRAAEPFETLAARPHRQLELLDDPLAPGYKTMYSSHNKLNWKIFSFYETAPFEKNLRALYVSFFLTSFAWIVLLAVVMFVITFLFTRPIRRLAKTMEQVNDFGDLVPVKYRQEDEIGRLSKNYNRLVEKIHSLLEDVRTAERKKNQYELHMLQSQIGPHFLYNTLACIASLVRQNQPQTAQRSIAALIELLSYSFEQTGRAVTLADELREIQNYIKIELMRYGEVFTFETRISPEVSHCPMLKLTLQPLVENAIFHGIIPRGDAYGRIVILAHKLSGDAVILVCDNGVGISPGRCADILTGQGVPRISERLSSIGVSNVQERLRLTYGEKYGIRIRSRLGMGTVMRLRIPLKDTGEGCS